MDKTSELECYMYFMWNEWCKQVCEEIFADTCSEHLWDGWRRKAEELGATGAVASWYLALDNRNRRRIREAAVRHYNKEG